MAEGDATEQRRVSLPWFLPFICFIPLLIAAPLWHRASAADAVTPNVGNIEHLTTAGFLKNPVGSNPVVEGRTGLEQPAQRPVRRQQLHAGSPPARKHSADQGSTTFRSSSAPAGMQVREEKKDLTLALKKAEQAEKAGKKAAGKKAASPRDSRL